MKKQENKLEIIENNTGLKLDYDEISPFTGNKCVLIEADDQTNTESRICMETGYTTKDIWKIGSKAAKTYEKMITQLMIDTKYKDKTLNQIWYLSTMPTSTAVLYPVGTSKDDYYWEIARIVPIVGPERQKYPVPDKENEYYTSRLDTDNAFKFDKNEFSDVVDKFYAVLAEEEKNEN